MKLASFDLISDTHLDFWLDKGEDVDPFVDALLPEQPSKALVIAGDLGHYNEMNYNFLRSVRRYYGDVLIVAGNHDYYLIDSRERWKHRTDSIRRWTNMKALASMVEGVRYLEGNIVEIDGVRFGGTGMWYDFSYGVQALGFSLHKMFDEWESRMNDSALIFGPPRRPLEWYDRERTRLDRIVPDCDVIVTHVGPDWSQIADDRRFDPLSGCYYFDGSAFMDVLAGKIWCFGHTHQRIRYERGGCRFVSQALGYPDEQDDLPPYGMATVRLESE